MIVPNPLCPQRKVVLMPGGAAMCCSAFPNHGFSFAWSAVTSQLRLGIEASFLICLKTCGLNMNCPWPADPRQYTSPLSSSFIMLFLLCSQCYCPPCHPQTLETAGILVQSHEKPSSFLLPSLFHVLCWSCPSPPLTFLTLFSSRSLLWWLSLALSTYAVS